MIKWLSNSPVWTPDCTHYATRLMACLDAAGMLRENKDQPLLRPKEGNLSQLCS
jgi:hypothetical protein